MAILFYFFKLLDDVYKLLRVQQNNGLGNFCNNARSERCRELQFLPLQVSQCPEKFLWGERPCKMIFSLESRQTLRSMALCR